MPNVWTKAKMVAREVFMCGLRKVPLVGEAAEVVESIRARHELASMEAKVREIESSMTSFERGVRDLARAEFETLVATFRSPGLEAPAFTAHVNNLFEIRKEGWEPALFEGLLQQSPYWDELRRNPHHYGEVLQDHAKLNPKMIHVVIDADKTRVLELTPFAFASLLSKQRGGAGQARMHAGQDIWALPALPAASAEPTPAEQAPAAKASGPGARVAERVAEIEKYRQELAAKASVPGPRPAPAIAAPPRPGIVVPPGLPTRRPSLTEALKQRQAHEEEERRQALRREQEARAARQRQLDEEYAALRDALAEQLSAGQYAQAGKTLRKLESLRPTDAELREVRAFLTQRVPEHLPRRVFANSVGMKFVEIHAGTFLMGSPADEPGRQDNETQHRVTLERGFLLGVHPVTQAQWQAVMGTDLSSVKGENLPVEQVSWADCQEFCQKLGKKEGRQYRLPTEAEWEYACRAGTTSPFSFGQTITTGQANYDCIPPSLKNVNRGKATPVGSFPANPWGLYDMHGNVWEWCQDTFGPYPAGGPARPVPKESRTNRVMRGGSWAAPSNFCRSAYRNHRDPNGRRGGVGCRVAYTPKESA